MDKGYTDRILNLDCIEGMKQLPDGSATLVVADPPYNLNKEGAIEALWVQLAPPGRCSTRCDHDSQCTLSAGHGDRHETDHGCICYDPIRGGVAGDFCGPGNECGRLGCLECQQ